MLRILALLSAFAFASVANLALAQEDAPDAPVTPDAPAGTTVSADEEFNVIRFELNDAEDLRVICSISFEHPDYDTARSFCIGYVAGALNYYRAIAAGPTMGGFICTDRPIPRTDIITAFLEWTAAHPEMSSAPAVENVMRAAAAKWPCIAG